MVTRREIAACSAGVAAWVAICLPTLSQAQQPNTTLGCTDTGTGYLYCLPAPGTNNGGESGRSRMNRETVQRGVNALVPPQPSPETLANTMVGLAIGRYPQESGEDQLDYTIRVTRIARDAISERSPQAAAILGNRLVELEDMKIRRTSDANRSRRGGPDSSATDEPEDCISGREACRSGLWLSCGVYKRDFLRRGETCSGITDVTLPDDGR